MFARVGEDLQEDIDVRVHGQNQVLIHPHGQIPEHCPELDGEDGHATDHHHGNGVAGQNHHQWQQGIDAQQHNGLDHGQ